MKHLFVGKIESMSLNAEQIIAEKSEPIMNVGRVRIYRSIRVKKKSSFPPLQL